MRSWLKLALVRAVVALLVAGVGFVAPGLSTAAATISCGATRCDYDVGADLAFLPGDSSERSYQHSGHDSEPREVRLANPSSGIMTRVRPALDSSAPNSSRGLFDVRSPNPGHPPLDDVTSAMQRRYHPNCDCSEIAQDLLEASGGQGRIVRYEPQKGSVLRTPEAGGARIEDYVYHEVFTDGRYVYDPLFGPTPVPKGDYDRMIRDLNPGVRGG